MTFSKENFAQEFPGKNLPIFMTLVLNPGRPLRQKAIAMSTGLSHASVVNGLNDLREAGYAVKCDGGFVASAGGARAWASMVGVDGLLDSLFGGAVDNSVDSVDNSVDFVDNWVPDDVQKVDAVVQNLYTDVQKLDTEMPSTSPARAHVRDVCMYDPILEEDHKELEEKKHTYIDEGLVKKLAQLGFWDARSFLGHSDNQLVSAWIGYFDSVAGTDGEVRSPGAVLRSQVSRGVYPPVVSKRPVCGGCGSSDYLVGGSCVYCDGLLER